MPYKEGKQWRATPRYKGLRLPTKTFFRKSEAIEYEREQIRQAKKAVMNSRDGLDLLTFCSKYLVFAERYIKKTYKEKQVLCRRMLEFWSADKLIQEITPDDISTFLGIQARDRSNNAANKDRKNMSAMWEYGIEILGLEKNPISRIKKFRHEVGAQETHTEEEVLKILAAADRHERVILRTFIETAGRRMEIWGLRWTDINIEHQSVKLWTRKTRDGSMNGEWLPISDELASEFKWLWDQADQENPFVFPSPRTGQPYVDPRKWYFRLCDRSGIRRIGFHAFRRYVASILDDKYKQSRKLIQKLLRHKKESTTERYLHQIHTDLKNVAGLAMPEEKMTHLSAHKKKGVNDENR